MLLDLLMHSICTCAGVETLVDGLCQFLLDGPAGELTVGIFGSWGSGKSSLMKQLMWRLVCHTATDLCVQHHKALRRKHALSFWWRYRQYFHWFKRCLRCDQVSVHTRVSANERILAKAYSDRSAQDCVTHVSGAQGKSEPVADFDSTRQRFIDRTSDPSAAGELDREHLREMALPRLIVVWFNAWECTSAEDTWARCDLEPWLHVRRKL